MAAAPFKVKALFEYTSSHEDDLPFQVGQIITVTDVDDPDWYGGEYTDDAGEKKEGIFPRNFVEKYEPTAPPRPSRPRKRDSEIVSAPPLPPAVEPEPSVQGQTEPEDVPEQTLPASPPPLPPVAEPRSPRVPPPPSPKSVEQTPVTSTVAPVPPVAEPVAQPPPKAPAPARSGPPPVSEKPTSSSFKDRIAAFNKAAATPVAPFKPGGLSSGSSGFIKKPFVAPPPSRNAYVPPPREAPAAKIYRRDEDPEIKEREAENLESAEKAGLASASHEDQDEDQPKPTSLKERIALLQKQQVEAAQRHAEAAAKKEKPKRPPKKRVDSGEAQEVAVEGTEPPLSVERRDTESTDEAQPPRQIQTRRKSSRGPPDDGNEADMSGAGDTTEGQEDLTEREDSDEKSKPISRAPTGGAPGPVKASDELEGEDDEDEEEDDEIDPEVRRKEELRARMAKMSGGMGMMGMHMFGAPMPAAGPKKKKTSASDRRPSEPAAEGEVSSSRMTAPPIPTMMALPGMGQKKPKAEEVAKLEEDELPVEEDTTPITTSTPRDTAPEFPLRSPGLPPPVPGVSRPAPPPVPAESRPPPPPPPTGVASPSIGSESDDEMSESARRSSLETPRLESGPAGRAPPIPLASPPLPSSPRPSGKRSSVIGDEPSPSSPQPNKRNSRPPPPIPGVAPPASSQSRPPPPPPPGRSSTSDDRVASPMKPGHLDNGEEEEVTEYEGDYDTDIASSVPHKDALKSHARDSSLDDSTPVHSPTSPPSMPPPIPSAPAPRAVPPPIPSQPPPNTRLSTEMPHAAPPPPPPPKMDTYARDDDEYDPYNYSAPRPAVLTAMSYAIQREEEDISAVEPALTYQSPPPPPPDRRGPPPAPPSAPVPAPAPTASSAKASARQSLDVSRQAVARRSMDVHRPSMESGFVANDVDLAEHTSWWLQPNGVPPVFQGRRDIFFESEESTTSQPGGRTVVTKEVYILFTDYSQTIITARFDPQNPADTELDQRHEPPPRSLRQDQLEQAYERFGMQIANSIALKKDTVVGDGTPQGLVYDMLRAFPDALPPVGTRAYGSLVYANIGNASTQMNDEIRPGDIISIRNAKFQGKHGAMHQKYSMEVGKPDHVGIVSEWDGVKKKVRAWEQGRESKKTKQESFKLEDLRSGEVKIWRIMPRSWVGWGSQH